MVTEKDSNELFLEYYENSFYWTKGKTILCRHIELIGAVIQREFRDLIVVKPETFHPLGGIGSSSFLGKYLSLQNWRLIHRSIALQKWQL